MLHCIGSRGGFQCDTHSFRQVPSEFALEIRSRCINAVKISHVQSTEKCTQSILRNCACKRAVRTSVTL